MNAARRALPLIVLGTLSVVLAACGGSDPQPTMGNAAPQETAESASPESGVIWSADMEEGTLADWFFPETSERGDFGGMLANNGGYDAVASSEEARSGRFSLKASIWPGSDPDSGVRAFRWRELEEFRELTFSAWFLIPVDYERTGDPAGGFWNLFQFKSQDGNGRNDPLWALYVRDGDDGRPYLFAGWGSGGTEIAGPFATSPVGRQDFEQSVATLPIGRWFKLEAFLRQSKDFDGRLTVWQDGLELYDFTAVRTSYPHARSGQSWGANNAWSVNNYSDGLSPSPATIYIDDAQIIR